MLHMVTCHVSNSAVKKPKFNSAQCMFKFCWSWSWSQTYRWIYTTAEASTGAGIKAGSCARAEACTGAEAQAHDADIVGTRDGAGASILPEYEVDP